MQHLLSIDDLDREQIQRIFQQARLNPKWMRGLDGCTVACLFFEPSTRTCLSFELAAKKLKAIVLAPNLQFSSLQKGETFLDTVRTVEALGADIIVLRHSQTGSAAEAAALCGNAAIINAGDGIGQHPSQALSDLFTIAEHNRFGENFKWSDLRVAIVGDSKHSRVANSLISAFKTIGCNDLRLVGPKQLLPDSNDVECVNTLSVGLKDRNIVIALRNQLERWDQQLQLDSKAYAAHFMITERAMRLAAANAILLHPGPVHADVEIAKNLLTDKLCLIARQVKNGRLIRQALLNMIWQQQLLQNKHNHLSQV